MNKLYEEQKNTTYKLTKELNLSKDYLYKYTRGIQSIESLPFMVVSEIAKLEKIQPKLLYKKMIEYQLKKEKYNE